MAFGYTESLIGVGIILYLFLLLIVLSIKPIRRAWKNAQRRKLISEMRDAGINVVTRTSYGSYRRS